MKREKKEGVNETIMVQIPQMSNRNILRTPSILRKKLPKEMFKTNLRKVLEQRSNLLDDLFDTELTEVVDAEGEQITMPVREPVIYVLAEFVR